MYVPKAWAAATHPEGRDVAASTLGDVDREHDHEDREEHPHLLDGDRTLVLVDALQLCRHAALDGVRPVVGTAAAAVLAAAVAKVAAAVLGLRSRWCGLPGSLASEVKFYGSG